MIDRRTFLGTLAVASASFGQRLPIRKAVEFSMLPTSLSVGERFLLARDCGFQEIECPTTPDPKAAEEIFEASKNAKLRIHSVMNQAHWSSPLSSADPDVVARSLAGMCTSLENAHLWGSDTVLLVPAVVNAQTSYREAWDRSQKQIRTLLPLAEQLHVIIGIEEVWNKFLLSPLEMARYIDDFQSPWVRAYFDVGNVVINGYPQDWIRTLGKRIVKLHLKDFTFKNDPQIKKRVAEWVNLRDGEIDWKEVYRALQEVGFTGTATVELSGGDEAYLKDVSRRVDLIFNGQ